MVHVVNTAMTNVAACPCPAVMVEPINVFGSSRFYYPCGLAEHFVQFAVGITPVPFGISGTGVFFYTSELGDFFHLVSNTAHEGGETFGSACVSIIGDVSKAACGR